MTASINMDTTTTTQSISQNDNFSLTSYSLQGFLQFLMHNSKQIIISMLFLLLAFGQKLFSNTFSIDTQGIIQNNDALYKSWFELERFGLVLFKKLTGTYLYNNALASFTIAEMPKNIHHGGVLWHFRYGMGISPMLSFSCHKAATGIFHDSLCRFAYFRRDVGIFATRSGNFHRCHTNCDISHDVGQCSSQQQCKTAYFASHSLRCVRHNRVHDVSCHGHDFYYRHCHALYIAVWQSCSVG